MRRQEAKGTGFRGRGNRDRGTVSYYKKGFRLQGDLESEFPLPSAVNKVQGPFVRSDLETVSGKPEAEKTVPTVNPAPALKNSVPPPPPAPGSAPAQPVVAVEGSVVEKDGKKFIFINGKYIDCEILEAYRASLSSPKVFVEDNNNIEPEEKPKNKDKKVLYDPYSMVGEVHKNAFILHGSDVVALYAPELVPTVSASASELFEICRRDQYTESGDFDPPVMVNDIKKVLLTLSGVPKSKRPVEGRFRRSD